LIVVCCSALPGNDCGTFETCSDSRIHCNWEMIVSTQGDGTKTDGEEVEVEDDDDEGTEDLTEVATRGFTVLANEAREVVMEEVEEAVVVAAEVLLFFSTERASNVAFKDFGLYLLVVFEVVVLVASVVVDVVAVSVVFCNRGDARCLLGLGEDDDDEIRGRGDEGRTGLLLTVDDVDVDDDDDECSDAGNELLLLFVDFDDERNIFFSGCET